jgi:hypothetical protein
MNLNQFERSVRMHRAYADLFTKHFIRLAGRQPTEAEVETLENAPLCLTGMRLELVELRFSQATALSEVEAELEFLQREVASSQQLLKQAFENFAAEYDFHPAGQATYLILEEQLLHHVKQNQFR